MEPEEFYRINVQLGNSVLGYFDVNPQNPSGESPGDDVEGLYAFRLGENLPVKVFITPQVRCATAELYVIQCVAQGVIDPTGGVVTLEGTNDCVTISTHFSPNSIPGGETVIVTMERIDPELFYGLTTDPGTGLGEYCIPGLGGLPTQFDAPLFGDCLRVTTIPELDASLLTPAILEICITTPDVTEDQLKSMQIIRFSDDADAIVQGVEMLEDGDPIYPSTCLDNNTFGLLPVPDDGVFHYAARAVNSVASWLGPQPLAAHGEISLGGLVSEFSRFRWGLPGEMVIQEGDDIIIQQDLPDLVNGYDIPVSLLVQDAGAIDVHPSFVPEPVDGATVHFENGDDVITDPTGIAGTTWTLPLESGESWPAAGAYEFDATALGLLAGSIPDIHDLTQTFTPASVTFNALVVGVPGNTDQSPPSDPPLTGLPGETLITPLSFTVTDAAGNPVAGFTVIWTTTGPSTTCTGTDLYCDGQVVGSTVTEEDGTASGIWTLSGIPGTNTVTATVGGQSFTFTAGAWSAIGGCEVVIDGIKDDATGEWDCATEAGNVGEFTANVSGGDAAAEVMWQTDGTDLFMLVRVQRSALDKVNSVRIDFRNTPESTLEAQPGDDAIGFDAGDGFFDEYLTDKCANRSQSGCGATDDDPVSSSDGAQQNLPYADGQWTVYELRHPLAAVTVTAEQDFDREVGKDLGFYVTLRVGNGAQGNTQWPGFRMFEVFTIQ
jgi:hypothetical protein